MMHIVSYYGDLFACPGSFSAGQPQYCCGPDPSSCCSNKSYFTVPVGTLILRQFQLSDHATIFSTGGSTAAMPTASATRTGTTSAPMVSSTGSTLLPSSHPSNGPSSKSLGIGLGIGLPLGIVLLALLFLHYRELRKHNKQIQSGANETTPSQHTARLEPGLVQ